MINNLIDNHFKKKFYLDIIEQLFLIMNSLSFNDH